MRSVQVNFVIALVTVSTAEFRQLASIVPCGVQGAANAMIVDARGAIVAHSLVIEMGHLILLHVHPAWPDLGIVCTGISRGF